MPIATIIMKLDFFFKQRFDDIRIDHVIPVHCKRFNNNFKNYHVRSFCAFC